MNGVGKREELTPIISRIKEVNYARI